MCVCSIALFRKFVVSYIVMIRVLSLLKKQVKNVFCCNLVSVSHLV